LEQAVERLALVGVEPAEDVVLSRCECRLGLVEAADAAVGELDDVAPAVVDRPAAGDQAVVLELVEQADEVRPVDSKRAGERLLGAAVVVAEESQGNEVTGSQAERRQRGFRAEPGQTGEVVEQRGGPMARRWWVRVRQRPVGES
jgi:hypothetical protein